MCHTADSTDAPHPGQVLNTATNEWSTLQDLPRDGDSYHGYIWAHAGAFEHGTFFVFGNTQRLLPPQKNFKARSYHPTTGRWSTESGIESYVRGRQQTCVERGREGGNLGNAVGHNGKLYLLGWDNLTPQIIIYDVVTKLISLGPSDSDGPRHSFAMGIFNGAIFIAGGQTYANRVLSSVKRLDVGGNTWQHAPDIPDDGHTNQGTSAEVDGGWWIRFRDDPTNILGKVWVYDGSAWRQNGNYPGSRGQHHSSNPLATTSAWNCAQFATASA